MKIFISWSGDRSKAVARVLRQWLPHVIQTLEPWMSDKDLNAGDRWSEEIKTNLSQSRYGIICVTADNQTSPWLNFESGVLSNTISSSKVAPYLFNLEFKDMIKGPLGQFQAKRADQFGTWEILESLNKIMDKPLDNSILLQAFQGIWPKIEEDLKKILDDYHEVVIDRPKTIDDKVDDLLLAVNKINLKVGFTKLYSTQQFQEFNYAARQFGYVTNVTVNESEDTVRVWFNLPENKFNGLIMDLIRSNAQKILPGIRIEFVSGVGVDPTT